VHVYCVAKGEKLFTLYPPSDVAFMEERMCRTNKYVYDNNNNNIDTIDCDRILKRHVHLSPIVSNDEIPWILYDPNSNPNSNSNTHVNTKNTTTINNNNTNNSIKNNNNSNSTNKNNNNSNTNNNNDSCDSSDRYELTHPLRISLLEGLDTYLSYYLSNYLYIYLSI
jgi:hypothetical protein